jgi:hypothetical protein
MSPTTKIMAQQNNVRYVLPLLKNNYMKKLQSTSPVPKKEIPLTFPEAIAAVIGGSKISKKEWGNNEFYGELRDGRLKLRNPAGVYHDWIISDGDMMGQDWFIVV